MVVYISTLDVLGVKHFAAKTVSLLALQKNCNKSSLTSLSTLYTVTLIYYNSLASFLFFPETFHPAFRLK